MIRAGVAAARSSRGATDNDSGRDLALALQLTAYCDESGTQGHDFVIARYGGAEHLHGYRMVTNWLQRRLVAIRE